MTTYQDQIDSSRACITRAAIAPRTIGPAVNRNATTATREAPEETLHRAIRASSNGDNTLIQAPRGRIAIYKLALWNPSAIVNIQLWDGASSSAFAKLLYELDSVPLAMGLTEGYSPDPHFIIREGNPFVLNLSQATTISGYLKYRIIP
jgi:hypothetical protein